MKAKLELVLGIARAIGLTYTELFDFLYPERPDRRRRGGWQCDTKGGPT